MKEEDFSDVTQKEIADFIRAKTGCVGVFVLVSNSLLPCPDEKAGDKCQGHMVAYISEGIDMCNAVNALNDLHEYGPTCSEDHN